MLQQDKPQDYVLATGEIHSVRECCEYVFTKLGMTLRWEGKGIEEKGYFGDRLVIDCDEEFFRPAEVQLLHGDSSKAQKELVSSEPKDQNLIEINEPNISETHDSSTTETIVEQVSTPRIATLKEIEMDAIKSSVERNKWNMTTTAEELGISRMTLYRKLEQYGLRSKEQ